MSVSTSAPTAPVTAAPVPPAPAPGPPAGPPVIDPTPPSIGSCGLPGYRFFQSYYWQFLVTNLNTSGITNLNRIASNRAVVYTLNDAAQASLSVPSANKLVNIPYTDGDPKLDEGVRCLYGFRHEGTGAWTCRFAGLIMQINDSVSGDVSKTDINAWDPWRYLDMLPIVNEGASEGRTGVMYIPDETMREDQFEIVAPTVEAMVCDQLVKAIVQYGDVNTNVYNSLFIDFGQTAFYTGNITQAALFGTGGNIPLTQRFSALNGTSLGQFLRDIAARNWADFVLTPIWDPINRPGFLAELNIYFKAGTTLYDAVFGWDEMPRSVTTIDRQRDGTQRANNVQYYHSRGGPAIPLKLDVASQAKFRTYFHSQYFPTQGGFIETLESLATAQLLLRTAGVETITVSPTPERAKVPLLDYTLGDTVQVYASDRLRKSIFNTYRVLQIPINISDEGVEQVTSLTLKQFLPFEYIGPFGGPGAYLAAGRTSTRQNTMTRRTPASNLPGP